MAAELPLLCAWLFAIFRFLETDILVADPYALVHGTQQGFAAVVSAGYVGDVTGDVSTELCVVVKGTPTGWLAFSHIPACMSYTSHVMLVRFPI